MKRILQAFDRPCGGHGRERHGLGADQHDQHVLVGRRPVHRDRHDIGDGREEEADLGHRRHDQRGDPALGGARRQGAATGTPQQWGSEEPFAYNPTVKRFDNSMQ